MRDTPAAHARQALRVSLPLAALTLTAVAVLLPTPALGGFTAKVTNVGDQTQSGSLITSATSAGVTECDLSTAANSPIGTGNAALCTGSPGPSGQLPSSGTAAVSTVIADKGSLAATAASMTKSTCGAVALANAKTATDPMLVRGNTIGYAQTGPLTGSTALSLSGTNAYAAEVKSASATTTFTEVVWFKAAANGTMLGFTNTSTTTSPTTWDRMLWLDPTGHVVFGVKSSSNVELVSPAATYANNAWHLAAGTVSSSGMTLTIDGVAVATTTSVKSASSYTGYWHAGWDNVTSSWADPPSNAYFTGLLANAAIFPPLSTAQIAALLQRRNADHLGEPAHDRRHHELVDARRQRHDGVHRNHPEREPERVRVRRRHHRDRGRDDPMRCTVEHFRVHRTDLEPHPGLAGVDADRSRRSPHRLRR